MTDSLSLDTNVITTKIKQYRFNKFLIENLNPSKRRAIITYEPCVVSSVKYKKQFKFIAIERDGLCLTENAPSNYRRIVDFADILDVILESDQPDFLKGKDHDDSQHVVIKYLANQKLNKEVQEELKRFYKEKEKTAKKEKLKEKKDYETIEKLLKPSAEVFGKITVGELVINERSDAGAKNSPKITKKDKKGTKSSPKNEKENMEKTDLVNPKPPPPTTQSIPAVPLYLEKLLFADKNIEDDIKKKKYIILPISSKPSTNANTESLSLGLKYEKVELDVSLSTSAILEIGLKKIKPPMVEQLESNFKNMNLILNARDSVMKDAEDEEKIKEDEKLQRTIVEFIYDICENFEKSEKSILAEEVLDIYLLNRYSMLYFYLRQAWINFKIRQAEGRNHDEDERRHFLTQDELKSKFEILKQDLTNLTKMKLNLEKCYEVIKEIKEELECGDCQSKRYFWRDNVLFFELLKFIEIFKDSLFLTSSENNELLFRIYLDVIRILTLSLSESEVYESRVNHLIDNNGNYLNKLVEYVIFPNLKGFEEQDEYLNFLVDHTTCSINLLYELLILCVQAPFCMADDSAESAANLHWLVAIAENNKNFLNFFDRVMTIVSSCLTKADTGGMDGKETQINDQNGPILVLLYKCFTILGKFLDYDSKLYKWLKENYAIDFRYFLCVDAIKDILPKNYTLTFDLLHMIDDVVGRVL